MGRRAACRGWAQGVGKTLNWTVNSKRLRMVSNFYGRGGSLASDESPTSRMDDGIKEESIDIIYEISKILNTGLDRPTLAILVDLCEKGVDPTILAYMLKHLKEAKRNFLSNLAAGRPT